MRFLAIAWAALFVASAAFGKAPEPARQPPEQQNNYTIVQEPKRDERGTDQAPLVVKNYPQQTPEATKEVEEDRQEKAEADRWAIRLGVATIFIGICTLVILCVQAYYFQRQAKRLKETIEAMRTIANDQRTDVAASIAVAKDAAQAAKRTAETNEDELISGHRPWLIVSNIMPTNTFRTRHDRLRFTFELKNVGKTPAVNIFYNSEIMPVRDPAEAEFAGAVERLRPNRMAPGVTLVATDSTTMLDSVSAENIRSTPDRQDMAFLLVCIYYSFTFKQADSTGYYIAGYRIFEDNVADDGEVRVRFDRYHAHAI